jgi:hypothetical protein
MPQITSPSTQSTFPQLKFSAFFEEIDFIANIELRMRFECLS